MLVRLIRFFITKLIIIVLLITLLFSRGICEKLWLSPDGRYGAFFPLAPKEIKIEVQHGKGTAYQAVQNLSEGFMQYIITFANTPLISKKIYQEDDVKLLITMSANEFAKSLDVKEKEQKLKWGTFSEAKPKLDYEFDFVLNNVRLHSRGFWIIDDNQFIRIGVSYPSSYSGPFVKTAEEFLSSFMIFSTNYDYTYMNSYIQKIANLASLEPMQCPQDIVKALREGLEQKGGTFIGVWCFHSIEGVNEVKERITIAQVQHSPQHKRGTWRASMSGGFRLVENIGGAGVAWWVSPAEQLGKDTTRSAPTVIFAQGMR